MGVCVVGSIVVNTSMLYQIVLLLLALFYFGCRASPPVKAEKSAVIAGRKRQPPPADAVRINAPPLKIPLFTFRPGEFAAGSRFALGSKQHVARPKSEVIWI